MCDGVIEIKQAVCKQISLSSGGRVPYKNEDCLRSFNVPGPHPPPLPRGEYDQPRVVRRRQQREEARVDVRVDAELVLRRRLVARQPHPEQRRLEARSEIICFGQRS